jgi:hypothetical protein
MVSLPISGLTAHFLLLDEAGFIGMVQTMFNDANIELAGDVPFNAVERYQL